MATGEGEADEGPTIDAEGVATISGAGNRYQGGAVPVLVLVLVMVEEEVVVVIVLLVFAKGRWLVNPPRLELPPILPLSARFFSAFSANRRS